MKGSAKHSPFRLIKNLFNRIFDRRSRPTEVILPKEDPISWDKADAMVGTVRSWEQLSYNLSHKCYYVPGRFLSEARFPIRYIALHQRDAEEIPCILYIGEVETTETLPRGRIPVSMRRVTDPEESYYFFRVKEWKHLPHRIEIQDTPWGKPLFTHLFLLEHCKVSWELFALTSVEDYRLLESVHALLGKKGRKSLSYSITPDRLLCRKRGALVMTDRKGTRLGSVSVKEYNTAPHSTFLRLQKLLP